MADAGEAGATGRRAGKSAAAFRTISEVAGDLDVPQHVLRFWETKFSQIRPLKRAGGRRYYRPEDVALLRRIRELLYEDGYTIRGVQKLMREGGVRRLVEGGDPPAAEPEAAPAPAAAAPVTPTAPTANPADRAALRATLQELTSLRDLLRQHLK